MHMKTVGRRGKRKNYFVGLAIGKMEFF